MILGCDPGVTGALAAYDEVTATLLSVIDMPTKIKRVNGTDRRRLDAVGVQDWLLGHKDLGARRFIIEKVQGLPGQSAPAAFNFGFGFGTIISTARMLGYEVQFVTPQEWKGKMIHTSREGRMKQASLNKAKALFSGSASEFKRKLDHGRAEAALIARYGADYVEWGQ